MTEQSPPPIENEIKQRQDICAEIESLLESPDMVAAEKRLSELEKTWEGLDVLPEEELAPLNHRLEELITSFRLRQRDSQTEKEWELWANKTLKEELCSQIIGLEKDDDFARVAATIKKAQARWKQIGPVPRPSSKKLWNKFHSACQRNFERCKPYLDELRQQRQANLARQEEICRLAEEHRDSTEWEASAVALIGLQAEWKKMAATHQRKEQRNYKRFRDICNAFFERREVHLRQLDEQRRGNLEAKERICEQIEALAGEPDQEKVKKVRELQAEWKKAGTVPRSDDKKIWRRFRKACDAFYDGLDQQRQGNMQRREEICVEMEGLVAGLAGEESMADAAEKMIDLQQQWQAVGPLPKDSDEKARKRYQKIIDSFDLLRRRQHDEADELRQALLSQKQEVLDRIETLVEAGDRDAAADELQKLQEQWQGLGAVARAQEQELQKRYKAACACLLDGSDRDFEALRELRRENLKKKENICFLAGKLAGLALADTDGGYKTLSLADELKLAMNMNSLFSGASDAKALHREEMERLQREWKKIGPVNAEDDKILSERFRIAVDRFYGS